MGKWFWIALILLCTGCTSSKSSTQSQIVTETLSPDTEVTTPSELTPSEQEAVAQLLQKPDLPTGMPAEQPAVPATPPVSTGTLPINGSTAQPVAVKEQKASSPAPRVSGERRAYNQALEMLRKKNYTQAESMFDDFIAAHPNSKLMPNALYWKAETLYSRGKYAEAIFIFKDVTARYPKHPKGADALLKTGMSYGHLGDTENAKLHYRVLYEDYPHSGAARQGKKLGLQP